MEERKTHVKATEDGSGLPLPLPLLAITISLDFVYINRTLNSEIRPESAMRARRRDHAKMLADQRPLFPLQMALATFGWVSVG